MAHGTAASPRYLHTRWNFVVIVIDASFFMAALAFADAAAVLPVLMRGLGASAVLVGLMAAIQRAGFLAPQLLATSFVLHRERKFPFLIYPAVISRLPFLALALLFNIRWGADNPQWLLFFTIAIMAFFFFGDGLAGVPWHDICARTIPPTLRGRFFGAIQLVGGILGLGAGELVRRILADASIPFPYNYGRLFLFLCAGMVISTVFVALIREPRSSAVAEAQSFASIVRAIPTTLRRYPLLRNLIVCQLVSSIPLIALPFYVIYATERLDLPASIAGRFVQAAIIGSAGASMIWAYLSDRLGSTQVLRTVSWVVLAVPLCALLFPPLVRASGIEPAMAYAYAFVFLLNGTTWGGAWIGFTNYVLELAADDIRPLFLGLQATLVAPAVAMPFVGGCILNILPFEALFALAAIGAAAALLYVYRLHEPRHLTPSSAHPPGEAPHPAESHCIGEGETR